MIKIGLVEDDFACAERIRNFVERYQTETGEEVTLLVYQNGLDFIDEYVSDYDIIFMDIEMPHINGLETAKKLRCIDPIVPLVFVTVMAQLAIKGYEVSASDFIVKPIAYFNFRSKIDKAIASNKKDRAIVFQLTDEEGGKRFIASSDLYYIESVAHRCIFHTCSGTFYRFVSISEMEQKLEPYRFVRSDNSYLVNTAYVVGVKKDAVEIKNGDTVPISRSRKKKFLEKLTSSFRFIN